MSHFVKFLGRTFKFVKPRVHSGRTTINGTRHAEKNFWVRSIVTRLSPLVDAENSWREKHGRGESTSGGTNFHPIVGGIFLSLLNWGEKEEEKIPELIMSIKRSIWLIQKEEFKKAEQLLHVALRQAQTIQHYQGITYIYDVMANLAFEVGDYKKAETLFISVMQRLISTGTPKDDIQIIHISLKMAKLFQETGDIGKAQEGYEFCLEKLEEHMKNDPDNENIIVLWAMSLDWYARMLLTQSQFKKALNYFEQAYHLCLRVHGREHEQTVVLLNDLGTICCLTGDHDQAIKYLTSAAEIGQTLPDMVDLGAIHVNLGSAYLQKGLYDEARRECQRGLKMATMRNDAECVDEAKDCLDEIKKLLTA